jgi:hypothetical protein
MRYLVTDREIEFFLTVFAFLCGFTKNGQKNTYFSVGCVTTDKDILVSSSVRM